MEGHPLLRVTILRTFYWFLAWSAFAVTWAFAIPWDWKPVTGVAGFAVAAAGVLQTWLRHARLRRSPEGAGRDLASGARSET